MYQDDAIRPFPQLPFEIVCLIIEAVLEIEPRRALELVCLSRDIQPIVERALHRCIILRSYLAACTFLNMLKSPRFEAFENQFMVLCCTEAFTISTLRSIFSACSGLQTIAIFLLDWEEGQEGPERDVALDDLASSGPRPSKLSCDFRCMRRLDGSDRFSLPLFQNVTHLELDVDNVDDFDGRRLHYLTQLTHLSICDAYEQFHRSQIIQKLHLPDSVSVCILYSPSYLLLSRDIINDMIPDPRIVIAKDPVYRGEDDGNGHRLAEDDLDMWEEAEEIVKVRRAKLTAAN
ncbi:hypothetical protein C8J56DRAFT_1054576 [Mycena floridula]|nr:hypothetical protein C8J56DRAFT_1054576 [Mycena floridula]